MSGDQLESARKSIAILTRPAVFATIILILQILFGVFSSMLPAYWLRRRDQPARPAGRREATVGES